jgi:hypothetical protein
MKKPATKRKTPSPHTPPVPPVLGGRPSPRAKEDKAGEKFVPVEMIAQETLAQLLTPMEEIEAIKFLPDESTPRFFVIRKKDGRIHVELSAEMAARQLELSWKIKPELHGLVNGLMHLTSLPRNRYGNDTGQILFAMSQTGQIEPRYLIPASLALGMLELHLGDGLQAMLRQPDEKERHKAAKKIQKRLCAAVDALSNQSQAKPHGGKAVIETPVGLGLTASMPLAHAAILEAQKFIEREKREPFKADLRKVLKEKYKDAIPKDPREGFWTPIWQQAGLAELKEAKPWSSTQKNAKKSIGQWV